MSWIQLSLDGYNTGKCFLCGGRGRVTLETIDDLTGKYKRTLVDPCPECGGNNVIDGTDNKKGKVKENKETN